MREQLGLGALETHPLQHPVHDVEFLRLDLLELVSGSATLAATRWRGSSDAYGSWKTTWTRWWNSRSLRPSSSVTSSPSSSDLAGGGLDQPQDHPAQRRLAAAGLADETEGLTAGEVEGDVVHRPDHLGRAAEPLLLPEVLGRVLHPENGVAPGDEGTRARPRVPRPQRPSPLTSCRAISSA